MVVFTCNHCGESVHKPKIEKHYQFACRSYKSLTCVDCFKDFRDEEYVSHTKCLTEDERYAAKGAFKNGIVKKGDAKQDSWLDMIRSICGSEKNLKPSLRNLLNTISEYSNVPRKKQKFMNFIKSSSGNRANMKDVEEAWDIIEIYKSKNIQNNKTQDPQSLLESKNRQNDDQNSKIINQKRPTENDGIPENPKKKTKLSKVSQESLENTHGENTSANEENSKTTDLPKDLTQSSEFNFKDKILEILTKKNSISHKKLQKKILKAYLSTTGESNYCEEKVVKKLNKKLKKIPNVEIENDRVVLQC